MRVEISQRTFRMRTPIEASYGAVTERSLFELAIEGSDGVKGRGECAPLEAYDGVSLHRARAALDAYQAVLEDGDGLDGGELLDACRAADDLPQALAAVDLALWDCAGRRADLPVAALLAETAAEEVAVNATIGASDRASASAAAAAAAGGGLSLREAQGRRRRRRWARRRGARGARAGRGRCAWTPTARGRSTRRCG